MRKITPVMLVLLLVASLMANIDITQLETTEVIEDAGARSGADAELVAITSPKETQCNPECRNELFVGQETTFEVFIQNSGDQAITELGYKAQVWIADGNGNPIMLAKDSSGADLEYNNPDVICDDASVCDDQSLAAGAVFKGGKTTIQYGGGDATWTPAAGIYVIQIETYSDQDVDPGNDVQQVYVEVVDYLDVEIDIEWDDGSVIATGEGSKAFTVSVLLNGSSDFITHNLTMEIDVSGDLASATGGPNGDDLMSLTAGSLVHSVNVGTDQVVMVYQNESDPTDNITEIRTIMSDDINNGVWTYTGSVLPDSGNQEAAYAVDVSIGGYSLYGQFESCMNTVLINQTDAEGNPTTTEETYANFCEESFSKDDITRNNADDITGTLSTFHDIRISMLTINQGYNNDGTGIATYTVGAGEPGDLSVGTSYIDAAVEHRGSAASQLYHWNVSFTITNTDTNEVITTLENECLQGVEPSYNYAKLGTGPEAFDQGHACTMVEFDVGTYTIEAELIMGGKITDQKPSNNLVSMEKEVRNNLPVISSLDLVTQGDLTLGMENMLEFEVSVFDADDVTGEDLTYTWVGGAESITLAGCGGQGGVGRTCTTPIIQDFVTTFPVVVTITDAHGGEVSEEIIIEIWNDGVATDSTDSGITMDYSLTYFSKAAFTIAVTDGASDDCSEITLPDGAGGELSGQYSPVAVVDYEPVTTYAANDVLAQSIEMIFDSGLGASSLWFTTNCNSPLLTQLLADGATNSEDDSTKSVLSASLNGGVLPAGKFLLIDAPLQAKDAPSASIGSFSAAAGMGGDITMNWGLTGTPLAGDKIAVSITDASGDTFEVDLERDIVTYTYSGSSTTHGESYDIEVAVCNNDGLCSTPIGSATVVADKQVDNAAATGVSVTEAGDKWTLTWSSTGTTDDVASWNVCYKNREAFDAANMPTTCVNTGSAETMTADVMMSTAPGQYTVYFAVVPVDALGNTGTAGSSGDAGADAAFFKANEGGEIVDDNSDGDDAASGELPGWTWGAIGGVVVVAFIAGAFILSRGGGDGEDKDWDY
tara:strand:+ start:675 stop:3824 length:3150 start_codon:yes stop_codon:yes gene_type:complete